MKLRNKLLSLALVATVAATGVMPVFARKQAPTKHDWPQQEPRNSGGGMGEGMLLSLACGFAACGISELAQLIVKKAKGVEKLAKDDEDRCCGFGFLSALVLTGIAAWKIVEYQCRDQDNGGYSSK